MIEWSISMENFMPHVSEHRLSRAGSATVVDAWLPFISLRLSPFYELPSSSPNIFFLITLLQYYFQYFLFFVMHFSLSVWVHLTPAEDEFNQGTLQEQKTYLTIKPSLQYRISLSKLLNFIVASSSPSSSIFSHHQSCCVAVSFHLAGKLLKT